ncbi:hypothetical protein YN1HA_28340 [Sulfurisphaera ohwakuensis]
MLWDLTLVSLAILFFRNLCAVKVYYLLGYLFEKSLVFPNFVISLIMASS